MLSVDLAVYKWNSFQEHVTKKKKEAPSMICLDTNLFAMSIADLLFVHLCYNVFLNRIFSGSNF